MQSSQGKGLMRLCEPQANLEKKAKEGNERKEEGEGKKWSVYTLSL